MAMEQAESLRLLGLAKRAGRLAQGEDMVQEAAAAHKVRLLLLAADAAPGTVRRVRTLAGERIAVMALPCGKAQLGAALGRDTCAVCAVTDLGFAAKIAGLVAGEDPALVPIAQELARKQEKLLQRKKTKPRRK
ncbi:MAG: ribosomal L7Ae/L30e/S12e/Gadd45 family protein [Clostridiales bacterium]|nr:ribosomal L7Ae/L30e/S12e/Gadd45 family protein [Clostridiales bacterium]